MFTTRPDLRGTFGMVSSTHWLASQAGMAILERGGNAFDAAVAAGFTLQVVEPHLNGPGGDLPVIIWDARRARVEVICGQGVAPAAATIERFHQMGLREIPGDGLLPACVPGAFGAWMLLLRDHGTMRPAEVLEAAIGYAAHGYPVVPKMAERIAEVAPLFRDEWPESARVYLDRGMPQPGSRFRNPLLAETYQRIVREAEAAGSSREQQIDAALHAFYRGFVAEAIDRYCASAQVMDITGTRHPALLRGSDLSTWRASREAPVSSDHRTFTVYKPGPWSQAPVFLQQLTLLRDVDLRGMGFLSAEHIHTVIEGAKLAFADREAWYGDPMFADVPLETLLSPAYASDRRREIGARASLELRPGSPTGRRPRLPQFEAAPPVRPGHWTGEPSIEGRAEPVEASRNASDTVHVDAIDQWGNLVACTPSGGWLQSSPCIPGLGFCLGTRAQQFNLTAAHPNALAPGKRPRTTLSPSLAFRDGEPALAFGTPGGDQQDQWSFNFFLAQADFGLTLQEAIDAPMFHTTHFPSSFQPHLAFPGQVMIEDRVEGAVLEELRRRGHRIEVQASWSQGSLCAVGRDARTGFLQAAANPRGMQGYAVGR
ncbi:MAG TPA: gamma-glutamyltransferase family protein [Candidatus Limnocylindrales bacterium]|nr:gamma-glutamyltransferase family protein [Candidatus Limnocylindrales bacterium]